MRILLSMVTLGVLIACKIDGPQPEKTSTERKLVWSDEFDKAGLPDASKWKYDVGGSGFGNNELQYYRASRPENARVENGFLIIEARKEKHENRDYTSAKLITKGLAEWKYGRIDVRAKLPKGRGTWPAIWMLSAKTPLKWPLDGEIDIMEHVGFNENQIHGTIHTEAYNHVKHTQKGGFKVVPGVTQDFHVYSIDWTTDKIDFLIDNAVYYSISKKETGSSYEQWPLDQPFYLIINLAVGGNWGGQKGVDESIWPQHMDVDYVRVFQ
ncbi:glycoside hydrolase family 16 protein [Larkinella rosea]|uniref:Glycoside hydrolase family 16 protein n=1 Tax=Larkinella rosea TaxID=2025312 RepID=A0A3P1C160_9BACT|nr:glycoside hydrolase family 16 protein [Larkinella rosea]RRB07012.1 glycoside hydrolase family 16 protein [Larkinella rosea]